jgi:biotin carboxyl carrier protein
VAQVFGRKKTPTGEPYKAPKSRIKVIDAVDEIIIKSPMQGTVLDVFVASRQAVEDGETLLILEESAKQKDIVAKDAGVASAVMVSKGSVVNRGDILVTLEQKLPRQGEPQFTLFC